MPKHIIIVGAGILGGSIAWHLAKAGAEVTIIDAASPGGTATAGSWGWINASWGNPEPYFRLRERAMLEWRRIDREVPGLEVDWCGGLLWDLPLDKLETYATEHVSWGYGIRWVNRNQIRKIEPNLKSPPEVALHAPEEGKVEPLEAARRLVDGAVGLGARLLANTQVKWLTEQKGRVTGVAVGDGTLHADEVVLAAGVGNAALLETVGIGIALERPQGLLVHSAPLGEMLNGLVMAPEFHVKQDRAGRLVAGADFGGGFNVDDPEGEAQRLHEKVRAAISGAEAVDIAFHTVAERPTPADGLPMIGRIENRAGAYLVVTHSGVTLAPAIGRFVAEELLDARREALLEPFAPVRLIEAL